ncbi:hypothetical protein SAMN04488573_1285 [Bacillus sp. 5mfcol3.1]|uniref:hypothetical protein n=1 Tax=unclassified Bacillus (in: firmicutes) TaxID=185979 RepID=UPI000479EA93|nr:MULTISPECIES: hypothetical protein [unclassified Bacillus (in: firmicutes)]SFM34428.1 hypothetical protein SAMN04488573_1285 [Bacillus sp. 5mfcol3.1]
MFRNPEKRTFGMPGSLTVNDCERLSNFSLGMKVDTQKIIDKIVSPNEDMVLINIANSENVREMVSFNKYSEFLNYSLEYLGYDSGVYRVETPNNESAPEPKSAKVVTSAYYVLWVAGAVAVGAVLVIDIVAKIAKTKEQKLLKKIISAANIAGGKDFCEGVALEINRRIKAATQLKKLNGELNV